MELTLQSDITGCVKNVNCCYYGQLVFEDPIFCMSIRVGDLVTLRSYLDRGTAFCCIPNIYIVS
jgi:hypothetical protein